ncbi:ER membrane protein complex subunit 7-like [Puntigrus tetrazona]|uniref:ER membrane protein complex subunit 7-like n=1 Tax=Puntigrus tetrazona TaxID=1606681 RepID=UPI001C89A26B|nr:ER membrane protein complex subunit 7-like [Puntigrus tetrazona]
MKVRVRACVAALLLLLELRASFSLDVKLLEDEGEGEDALFRTPEGDARVRVSGRALVPGVRAQDWISGARVLLDGGEHVGFLRDDGSFTVSGVPSGSYVLEISSPTYRFQPVRVDVSSAGKMRARAVDYIRTSEVIRLPYPLQMRSVGLHSYFIPRETWAWSDFFMNPMVLMMVLPLLIILLLPKVFNPSDPEMRREMEQSMNMLNSNQELPDVSELMTKFFSSPKSHGKTGGGARGHKGGAPGARGGASRRKIKD